MSKEVIDEKVVELQFKNEDFEKGVKESLGTLDKLKQKLQLKGAAKAAESEFAAYKSGIFSLKDSVLKMWSSLEYEVAGKMKNLIKQFTVEPIMSGLSEYETQMGAIQTILANTQSKGTTLDEVNAALNTLNTYADKTIYNFTEMTKNIGTFTAAGVELDTAVNAIQGIANLAAVSGSTSQQASTAMYQLSQALSSGTVKLQDWNSVVNAGMGGQVFQDALKETAKIHGIAIDDMIKEQGSFRETLSEGWLTAEILTETLEKFTLGTKGLTEEQIEANRVMLRAKGYTDEQIDAIFELGNTAIGAATEVKTFTQLMDTLKESAQSGWSQTWSIIIGDFEEAKGLWTGVSDVLGGIINATSEARNNLLRGGLDTGWDKLMSAGVMDEEGFMYHFKEVAKEYEVDIDEMVKKSGSLEKALVQGFKDGTITSDMFTESLNRLTEQYMNCSDEELANYGYTRAQVEEMAKLNSQFQNGEISIEEFTEAMSKLSGRTLIIESLGNLFRGLVNIINPIKDAFDDFFGINSNQLYGFVESFNGLTKSFETFTEKHGDKIYRTFKGIFAVLDIGITIIKIFAKAIGKVIGAFTGPLSGGILNVTASLGDFLVSIHEVFEASTGLEEFANGVADAMINIVNSFKTFFAAAKEKIKTSGLDGFLNTLKTIWNFIKTMVKTVLDLFGSLGAGIADTLTGSGITTVVDLLNAGLITALLVKFKGMFDSIGEITDKFGDILDGVTGSLEAFQSRLKAETIKSIAVSVAILAASILVLSFIDQEKLEKSLAAITMLFAVLMGSMGVINKVGDLGQTAVSTGMLIGIAASLLLLSFALVKLGKMTDDGMIRGLVIMTGALAVMVGALHWMSIIDSSEGKMAEKGAKQLQKIAFALIVLTVAMKLMATMSWEDYGKAMATMGGALAIMVGSLTILSLINGEDTKMASKGAKELTKIAGMLIILALAFKLIATMSWDDIFKGGTVLIGGLLILVAALAIMQKIDAMTEKSETKPEQTKKVLTKTAHLALIAAALGILALSLVAIATLDWTQIIVGLGSIVAMVVMLELALKALNKIETKDTAPKVSSLIAIAGAIGIMAVSLRIVGSMKWTTIAKGLTAMASTLVILLGALKIISKFQNGGMGAKSLAGIAGSLMLLAIALGMLTTVMIAAGTANFTTILKGFTTMALVFAAVAIGANLLSSATLPLISFAGGVALLGLACLAAGAGIYLLSAGLSLISSSLGTAIETLCQVLIQSASTIGQAAAALLIGLIDGLVDVTDELVVGLLEIILNTLRSLAQFVPEIADALMDLILGVGEKLIEYIPEIVVLATKVIGKLFEAIIDAIKNIDTEALMTMITAVGAVALLMKLLASVVKTIPQALLGALGVSAVIAELVLFLGLIGWACSSEGVQTAVTTGGTMVKALESVLGVLTVMSLLMYPLAAVGALWPVIPLAMVGLAGVSLVIAELIQIMNHIGQLKNLDELKTNIEKAGTLFHAIGEAFGQAIGGFIGGIGVGVTESMIKMAENLSEFGEKLQPFITSIKAVDGETLKCAGNLALLMATIAGTDLLDKIVRFLNLGGNPFDKFTENLVKFGDAIVTFSTKVSDEPIDKDAITKATEAGTLIAEMASEIPITGALWGNEAGNFKKFSENLSLFSDGIIYFSKAVSKDSINKDAIKVAAEAGILVAEMSAEIPINGALWGNEAGSFKKFSTNLVLFADGIAYFSEAVSDKAINKDAIKTASESGALIAEMASKIPVTGALWGNEAGNLEKFSTNIGYFADGITAFSKSVTDTPIDVTAVTNAALAGGELALLAANIPKSIGVWGNDKGSNNMESFANQIGIFGTGLANFVTATSGINSFDNVAPAALAGGKLALLAGNIPNSIGVWGNDKGSKNMTSFKEQIVLFGEGMVGFMNAVAGISSFENVTPAIKAGKDLASIASELPNFIGVWGNDKGTTNMTSFKEQIVLFGEGIVNFGSTITANSCDWEAAKSAASAGVELAKITSTMSGENVGNMSTFANDLPALGTAISDFCTNISEANFKDMSKSINTLKQSLTNLRNVVNDGLANMSKEFSDNATSVSEALSKMMEKLIKEVSSTSIDDKFKKAGKDWIKKLKSGVKDQKQKLIDALETLVEKALKAIKTKENYNKFYDTGEYFAGGLAKGIENNSGSAVSAAQKVATAINDAIKSAWLINSPSKLAYEDGSYFVAGLTNALQDGTKDTFSSAEGLAEMAVKGMKGAISKVKDLIENGIDTQPTIKPVLDLSDINNKVGVMNGMLTMSPSVGVLAKVNSISSSMNKNQNRPNDDVVSAINGLSNKLDNASGDTYNINGVTYDDGSQLQEAIELIIRAANIERRK